MTKHKYLIMGDEKFHQAARDGYLDLLRSATKRELNSTDEDGMTATLWAAYSGNLDALRQIIGRGGDHNKADLTGFTPLHHACKNGHENVVHYLVNFGCNIWALDNEYHTALDIANLYDRRDIAQFLDSTHSKQESKNPKVVQSLKEKATRDAENNVKRYERLQKEVDRYVKKQEKHREERENNDFKAPTKGGFFKTLTIKLKGSQRLANNKKFQQHSSSSNFSDLAIGTGKRGVAKKIAMKQMSQEGGGTYDPKEVGTSGRRTLRSLAPGSMLVQAGSASDVMYLTNRENDTQGIRPALNNVFTGMPSSKNKWKSDSDLLDSGIDDVDEEEEKPGIFNRPMLGKISFLKSHTGMSGTFTGMTNGHRSASADDLDGIETVVNGYQNGDDHSSSGSEDMQFASQTQMKDVPWEADEVIDDDDDATPLVRFLETCELSGYLHMFTKQDIDLSNLSLLTDGDLLDLGLPMGPRRAIQHALKQRQSVLSQPRPIVDSFL